MQNKDTQIIKKPRSIAQQNPFATDLRTIIGYMNIIRDLERISIMLKIYPNLMSNINQKLN
ncbi:PhoU domain-containing protein [Spiroplasma endosymbiont of Lasioglossum malachurum]|uniref:PhoU domain-containing protein n=1 Tax=Spiroplasma endosymbiont of Lasioglossum malachurum TaxID=3066319 RepID=UPI0030D3AD2A